MDSALDYMVMANLLKESHNYYYLNRLENEAILSFVEDGSYFKGYDKFYGINFETSDLNIVESDWFEYVNSNLNASLFKTDISKYIKKTTEEQAQEYRLLVTDKINEVISSTSIKEIGDLGETLVIGHEKVRIKKGNREDLLHLIKKIPTALSVGYDIQSVELDARKRYIEVKTTISNKSLNFFSFHLTSNEWDTATSIGERYFVYRLMITRRDMVIYILQDPVKMYKQNKIEMTPRNGAEIRFNANNCEKTNLMIWKD